MGRMKELEARIRDGGDDAVAAMQEYLDLREGVLEGITNAFAGPRWIPVGERLPKAEEDVLTFGAEGLVIGYVGVLGCWHSVHNDCETGQPWLCDPGTVTHWMPLPPPPATPPAPPT